jgi:hypothetical protein
MVTFSSCEQCFQYCKMLLCCKPAQATRILQQHVPKGCKTLGGKRSCPLDREQLAMWDRESTAVMRKCVAAKFSQNADLGRRLIATGDAVLFERLPRFADSHWGVKADGRGANVLGQVLMQTRRALRDSNQDTEESAL